MTNLNGDTSLQFIVDGFHVVQERRELPAWYDETLSGTEPMRTQK